MASVEVIDSASGTGAAVSMSLTGISGDYKHIQACMFLRTSNASETDTFWMTVNSSTASQYYIAGINSGFNSTGPPWPFAETSAGTTMYAALGPMVSGNGATAGAHTPIEMWFVNYADSTTKNCGIITWRAGDNTNNSTNSKNPVGVAGWYSDVAEAVTSIQIGCGNNIDTDSWITLYGWRG
tara:strand:+ start:1295 stop:1840 length:546 start_codon:yes stop_codon:yes gene_type:complete